MVKWYGLKDSVLLDDMKLLSTAAMATILRDILDSPAFSIGNRILHFYHVPSALFNLVILQCANSEKDKLLFNFVSASNSSEVVRALQHQKYTSHINTNLLEGNHNNAEVSHVFRDIFHQFVSSINGLFWTKRILASIQIIFVLTRNFIRCKTDYLFSMALSSWLLNTNRGGYHTYY